MGLLNWFKKATFEGNIKRDIGEVFGSDPSAGSVKIVVQELEIKNPTDRRRFRLNIVFKALLAYQSMPVVFDETKMKEFVNILNKAMENSERDERS